MKDEPIQDFAFSLDVMTDDELFTTMSRLEADSEEAGADAQEETLARIALVEEVILDRYPGQALSPYRSWKERQPLI